MQQNVTGASGGNIAQNLMQIRPELMFDFQLQASEILHIEDILEVEVGYVSKSGSDPPDGVRREQRRQCWANLLQASIHLLLLLGHNSFSPKVANLSSGHSFQRGMMTGVCGGRGL